jgi:hypothetical protein
MQFLLEQFSSIAELLRHFYSTISHSGLLQRQKVEKIHSRLDERLQLLLLKKKTLQQTTPRSAGASLLPSLFPADLTLASSSLFRGGWAPAEPGLQSHQRYLRAGAQSRVLLGAVPRGGLRLAGYSLSFTLGLVTNQRPLLSPMGY